MKLCPRCGKIHHPEDRFCGFCGCNLTVDNISDFVTKMALNADDIKFDLGVFYYHEGKYEQAAEIFQAVLNEKPDHAAANEMYAKTQAALDNREL